MGLFGKAEKQARASDAQAESDRLRSMTAPELAIEVMSAFGPDGINAKAGHRQGPVEVVSWLLPGAPMKYRQPILNPVIEALSVLEHAELVTRRPFGDVSTYHASRLGLTALADGTVRRKLGLETT